MLPFVSAGAIPAWLPVQGHLAVSIPRWVQTPWIGWRPVTQPARRHSSYADLVYRISQVSVARCPQAHAEAHSPHSSDEIAPQSKALHYAASPRAVISATQFGRILVGRQQAAVCLTSAGTGEVTR